MSWVSWIPWLKDHSFSELEKKLTAFRSHQPSLTYHEQEIVKQIRKETELHNQNNVTRTMAYFHHYQRTPEMGWALLAHLVSRNAGWNMTDLKGDWSSRLLQPQAIEDYFQFMERANWLIFQDAYPQLLLYEQCKAEQKNYFHLLSFLHVSSFMQVMWNEYWEHRNGEQLAISLIINEQHYIEQRVIDQDSYSAPVIRDIKFYMEDWLDLNMILFPSLCREGDIVLYGEQVNSFPDIYKRIALGKSLYGVLFSPSVLPGVLRWCQQTPHTGSRKDYWPHFFSPDCPSNLSKPYQPRFHNGKRKEEGELVYSPLLLNVWPNQKHEPAMIKDWFTDLEVVQLLSTEKCKVRDVQQEYIQLVGKLESVVHAKEIVSHP